MLIKFDSEVGSFSMNRDIAVQLLQSMGHSGTVPGAMLASDIPGALARLKSTVDRNPAERNPLAKSPANPGKPSSPSDEEGMDTPVSLRQRAYPLIDLLTRASEKGKEVLWK